MAFMYQTVDKDFVETIVGKLKSQGIFDQFRKDCLADVDTKPAYQNLQERVNGIVTSFLEKHKWQENLNKTQLRESLRRHVQQGFLETGVDRIVDQVVNPKIYTVFKPKVEDVVYDSLGLPKPNKPDRERNLLSFILKHPPPPLPPPPIVNVETTKCSNTGTTSVPTTAPVPAPTKLEDLLPKDLDPISPGSVDDLTFSPKVDEQEASRMNDAELLALDLTGTEENSNDESKLSLSDLTSRDSTKNSNQTKSEPQFDIESNNTNNSTGQKTFNSDCSSPFKNFSNLNEKIRHAEIKLAETELTSVDEDKNAGLSETEVTVDQDGGEKCEDEDSLMFKLQSEDSRSSISSFSRDKNSSICGSEKLKNEEKLGDLQNIIKEDQKIDDGDSSTSNVDKLESKGDDLEKIEKKHSELSKHRSHELKHKNHGDKKDDKSKSSRSDKDRKHHHSSRHKSSKDKTSNKDHEGSHKDERQRSKEENIIDKHNKHGDKSSSKHKDNDEKHRDDKSGRGKHKESGERHKDDKGKTEKPERSKHKHVDDKYGQIDDKVMLSTDPLGLIDIEEQCNMTDRSEQSEKITKKCKEEGGKEEDDEKSDKKKLKECEDKLEKSKYKDGKSRGNDDRHKESRKYKDSEEKRRSDKSDRGEKRGKHHRDSDDKNKEERKHEKNKLLDLSDEKVEKDDIERSSKEGKGKQLGNIDSEPCSSSSSSIKEERSKSDDKDVDKEKSRKNSSGSSEKSKSRHSSGSSSSKNTKEVKKDRESKKRKGERCDEVKFKESRRSSDRDNNGGPGSSSSGSSNTTTKEGASSSNSNNKANETSHDTSGQDGSSSVEESMEVVDGTNDVDILLMKINDSIINDLEKKKGDDQPEVVSSTMKKPKIANNMYEIKKIMEARRNFEKKEMVELLQKNEEIHQSIKDETLGNVVEVAAEEQKLEESICEISLDTEKESIELNKQIEKELSELQQVIEIPSENVFFEQDAKESGELNDVFLVKVNENENQSSEVECSEEVPLSPKTSMESAELNKQIQAELAEIQAPVSDEIPAIPEIDIIEEVNQEHDKTDEVASSLIERNVQVDEHLFNDFVKDKVEEKTEVVRKPRIAKNIYEVRKIMHMKRRLERRQRIKAAALLMKQNEFRKEKKKINKNEVSTGEVLANKLAGELEITNAIVNSDSHFSEMEVCPKDNVENVEPKPFRKPKIAKNIFEVRKIIRARNALKRKLKIQSKNLEVNVSRKHMKSLLNSKKLSTKRKCGDNLIRLKFLTKDTKNKLKKDVGCNSGKLMTLTEEEKVENEEIKEFNEENIVSSVPLNVNENITDKVIQNYWQEKQETFLGFTENDINAAVSQLEKLRSCITVSGSIDNEKIWSDNSLDGNSNMVKSSLVRNRKRRTNKLTMKDISEKNHDQVVQDILTGKNGCSIKLTKNAGLDEQARNVLNNRKKNANRNLKIKSISDDDNDKKIKSISDNINYGSHDNCERLISNSLTDANLGKLINESKVASDSVSNDDNSKEKNKIHLKKKKSFTEEMNCNNARNNKNKFRKKENAKGKINNTTSSNMSKKGSVETKNHNELPNKQNSNYAVSQEEKGKRPTRASLRSSQRYDSTDLYKPRLSLSTSSSRTRFNRAEYAEKTTSNVCKTLSITHRKVS